MLDVRGAARVSFIVRDMNRIRRLLYNWTRITEAFVLEVMTRRRLGVSSKLLRAPLCLCFKMFVIMLKLRRNITS